MKTCSRCKIEKPFEDFGKDRSTKDGWQFGCKACRAEYRRSEAGKAAEAKWKKSDTGRASTSAAQKKYNTTEAAKASRGKWRSSDAGKSTKAKWHRENYTPSPEWEIKKHLPHTMYLIRFTQGNRTYIKVGLTGKTTEERFARDVAKSKMNNLEILDTITFKDFETCNIAESIIHDATLDSHVTPVIAFGGSVNECRRPEALEQILSMFDSARAGMDNN